MKSTSFTQGYLLQRFRYDPNTGELWLRPRDSDHWRDRAWNTRYTTSQAGRVFDNGKGKKYRIVVADSVQMFAHRVIWCMHYGGWPAEIDHIDGNGLNNMLDNLREVTRTENSRNHRRRSKNTSGVTGVHWFKRTGQWRAEIKVSGICISLGYYDDIFSAAAARKSAELKYGFHENHGSDRPL
jgi:hypothetical protein